MATTKLYLDLRGKARDGKGNILITIAHNRTTTTVATNIRVSPDEWNGERVICRPDAGLLNAKLMNQKTQVDTQIALLQLEDSFYSMTAPQIKAFLTSSVHKPSETHLLSDVFHDYLDTPELSSGTKGLYNATLNKIFAFSGEKTTIEEINYKYLVGFEKYLAKTREINGRSIDLRNLRAICNYAFKTDLVSNYAFKNFYIKQEPTKKRNILVDKLREFYLFPCDERHSMFRDYFFLMFYFIGVNAGDLFLAPPSSVVNGRFEYIRRKTGKFYSIKIEPEAQALLDKYKGQNYLVEAMDHCKSYINFLHMMNDALKEIGTVSEEEIPAEDNLFGEPTIVKTITPIIPKITTYFSRHTWSTFASEIDIPIEVVSQALGHPFGNKTTLIYINPDTRKVDEANRKVIDFFFSGLI